MCLRLAKSIEVLSQDILTEEERSLYPALQRMLIKGWVKGEWGVTAENRGPGILLPNNGVAETLRTRNFAI